MDESKGRGRERSFHHLSLIHQTLSGGENELSVSMMCQTAGVSRSGYYAWLNAASARQVREAQDRADFELVLEAYNWREYSKGARDIYRISKTIFRYPCLLPITKDNFHKEFTTCPK